MVDKDIVKPGASKEKIIDKWLIPRTVYEISQFLGLASCYQQFSKRIAWMARPCFDLLKQSDVEIRKKKHQLMQ